jgi:hypothetical protein
MEMEEVLRVAVAFGPLAADRRAPERAVRTSVTVTPQRGGRVVVGG